MNRVDLMGRLVKDPETRSIGDGKIVVSFTLAINRLRNKDKTDFIPVSTFGKTAEFCEKYFHKGQQVAVCGSLQVNQFVDKEGKNRTSTTVVAETVFFAEGKKEMYDEKPYRTSKDDKKDSEAEQVNVDVDNDEVLPF